MIGTHPEKRPGQPAKQGRVHSVSYPKSGDPRKNFYGRHCRLSLKWNRYIGGGKRDYKTYEELRKARWQDSASSVSTTSTGAASWKCDEHERRPELERLYADKT